MSTQNPKKNWLLLLLSIPFSLIGLGFLFISIIPILYEGVVMLNWQPVQAKVLHVELNSYQNGDSGTTYLASGRYKYTVDGISYQANRLGITSGHDDVGGWQRRMSGTMKEIKKRDLSLRVYYNPDNPANAIVDPSPRWKLIGFNMIFVLVFGGLGFWICYWVIENNKKFIDTSKIPDAKNKPWLTHADWASPTVYSEAKFTLYIAWGATIFWWLLTSPALIAIPSELSKGNVAILSVLLFAVGGVGLLVWAIKATKKWNAIGRTPLTLDPYPGSIGGQVAGSIETNIRYESGLKFPVTLSSIYSYSSGSGKNRTTHERVNWHESGYANITAGTKGTSVQFCFDVPEGLPESELKGSRYNFWRLTMSADGVSTVAGIKTSFERQFLIPVFKTAVQSQFVRANSTAHSQAVIDRETELVQVFEIEETRNGINLTFPLWREKNANLSYFAFGSLFTGAGLFASWLGAPLFLTAIFVIVGGGIAVGSLYGLLNRLYTTITADRITTYRSLLGLSLSGSDTAVTDIKKLRIHRTGSTTKGKIHKEFFAVRAHLKNGKKIILAETLCGSVAATAMAERIALSAGGLALERTPLTVQQARKERMTRG